MSVIEAATQPALAAAVSAAEPFGNLYMPPLSELEPVATTQEGAKE